MAVWWSLGRCPLSGRWATGTVNSSVSRGLDSSAGRTSVSAPQVSRWTPPLGNAKVCKDHPMLLMCTYLCLYVDTVWTYTFQWKTLLQWCRCWKWLEDFLWSRVTTMLWFLSEDQVTFDESTLYWKILNDFLGLLLTRTIYVLIKIIVNASINLSIQNVDITYQSKKEHI